MGGGGEIYSDLYLVTLNIDYFICKHAGFFLNFFFTHAQPGGDGVE